MRKNDPLNQADELLLTIMRQAGLKYAGYWREEHRAHPQYSSFSSLAYILKRMGIGSVALNIEPAELSGMPFPLVAHLDCDGGLFVLVSGVSDRSVRILEGNIERQMPFAEFAEWWDGAVLLFDSEVFPAGGRPGSNIIRHIVYRNRLWLMLLPAVLLAVSYAFTVSGRGFFNLFFLFLSLAGLAVSSLLVRYYSDRGRVAGLCNFIRSGKVDCGAVLDSKYASLGGWVSWADLGFGWFLTAALWSLVASPAVSTSLVAFFSLLSLPVVGWLVAVQWARIGRFCLFCLAVQLLLAASGALAVFYFAKGGGALPGVLPCMAFVFGGFSLLAAFLFVKRALGDGRCCRELGLWRRAEIHTPRYREFCFDSETRIAADGAKAVELCSGDWHRVTLVLSPRCPGCLNTLAGVLGMLPYKEHTAFEVVFTADPDGSQATAAYLIHRFETLPADEWLRFLEGYLRKPAEVIRVARGFSDPPYLAYVGQNRGWCESNGIGSVPRIFFDGMPFPDVYDLLDLDYLSV